MRFLSVFTILTFLNQLVAPPVLMALSGGPSQPEFQSFQQAGSSDMVDPFTGDFKYNIPLLNVDGYPLNLNYSGNPSMEEEASWVGLGWNLTPGMINRTVRGIPDDFNGADTIIEKNNRRKEMFISVRAAGLTELAGMEFKLPGEDNERLNFPLSYSTMRGFSIGLKATTKSEENGEAKLANLSLSYGADNGLTVNPGLTFSDMFSEKIGEGLNGNASIGYNSRTGLQNISLSASYTDQEAVNKYGKDFASKYNSQRLGSSIPLTGINTYFPHGWAKAFSQQWTFEGKIGSAVATTDPDLTFDGMYYEDDLAEAAKDMRSPAIGYCYLQEKEGYPEALLDFNQDGDIGTFYEGMELLPAAALTYDLYSISAQGFTGTIRPKRMEVGAVHDPPRKVVTSFALSLGGEYAYGNLQKLGLDIGTTVEQLEINPLEVAQSKYGHFDGNPKFSLEQNITWMKGIQAGSVNQDFFDQSGGTEAVTFAASTPYLIHAPADLDNRNAYSSSDAFKRVPHDEVFNILTNAEAKLAGIGSQTQLKSYTATGVGSTPSENVNSFDRGADHHVGEIEVTKGDGSRYVYGIPVLNKVEKEITFNVSDNDSSLNNGFLVAYGSGDATEVENDQGRNHLYYSKEIPEYAYAHLLTGYMGSDYVDVTGDGITDDDIGMGVKFNWTRARSNYKWRSPMTDSLRMARLLPGTALSDGDQLAMIQYGEKEIWYPHSIETRNHIVFFQTSERSDGASAISVDGDISGDHLYQLDRILLYAKADWNADNSLAVPITTVDFTYDYELCPGTVNSHANGKLTLQSVSISHAKNTAGTQSPYTFDYTGNKPYSYYKTDRWGNYKSTNPDGFNTTAHTFGRYPYVNEYHNDPNAPYPKDSLDVDAAAWQLSRITLPSGGTITVDYESDTYAYVQDKKAQMMYCVRGLGYDISGLGTWQLHTGTLKSSLSQSYLYVDNPFVSTSPNYIGNEERAAYLAAGGSTDPANLIDTSDWLYFNIPVDIPPPLATDANIDKNHEYVRGYCRVEAVGQCTDSSRIYLKLVPMEFNEWGDEVNPILKSALDYAFINHQELIFGSMDPDDGAILKFAKNLLSITNELVSFFAGPYRTMITKDMCSRIRTTTTSGNTGRGFVRLNHPTGNKHGGGIRVKTITTSDGWDTITGNAEDAAIYGQRYYYDDPNTGVSSGVASWEPQAGNDENPFREPYFYTTNNSNSKRPQPLAYQEGPVGELFYPSGVVGYGHVRVESIHSGKRSTSSRVIHEFFTARDFPMQVISDPLQSQVDDGRPRNPAELLGYGLTEVSAATTQGHAFIFNDMHGKPKHTRTYQLSFGDAHDQLISSEEYIYSTQSGDDGQLHLSNRVDCVNRDGEQTQETIGLVTDIDIYSKESIKKTNLTHTQTNLSTWVIPGTPVIPMALPPIWPRIKNDHNEYRTATITKITQQRGILKQVVYKDQRMETTVENKLFDSQNGQVLVTSTTSGHFNTANRDKTYSAMFPAHWYEEHARMGFGYRNAGYRDQPDKAFEFLNQSDVLGMSAADRDTIGTFVWKGYMDALNCAACTNLQGDALYNEGVLIGNQVQSGVFVEGDEVIALAPDGGGGSGEPSGRYTVSEIITKEQFDLLDAITGVLDSGGNPLSVPPPNSVNTNAAGFITPICGSYTVDDDKVAEAYSILFAAANEPVALANAGNLASMFGGLNPVAVNSEVDDFVSLLKTGINDNTVVHPYIQFYELWVSSWGEEFFNYCRYMLRNPVLRSWLATSYQNCAGAQDCEQVDAMLTVLRCAKLTDCLGVDLPNQDVVQAMQFLMSEYGAATSTTQSNLHTFMGYMAYGYDDQLLQVDTTELDTCPPTKCDAFHSSLGLNTDYGWVTFGDFFEHHHLSSSSDPDYALDLFTVAPNAVTSSGDRYYGFVNECEVVDRDGYFCRLVEGQVKTCPDTLYPLDPYAYQGQNPGGNTDDPQDFDYEQSPNSDLVMFIDADGMPVDLEDYDIRIIRSGRRNLHGVPAGETMSMNIHPYASAPDPGTYVNGYLGASASTFSDEWTSDYLSDAAASEELHPFWDGYRGIFRSDRAYVTKGYRTGENGMNTWKDGRLSSYTPFWTFDTTSYVQITPLDAAAMATPSSGWIQNATITGYSLLGVPLEERNALDQPSSNLLGANDQVSATAVNAQHRDVLFESFEKYTQNNPTSLKNLNGLAQNTDHVQFFSSGLATSHASAICDDEDAHSGDFALKLTLTTPYHWEIALEPETYVSTSTANTQRLYDNPEYRMDGFYPATGENRQLVLSLWLKAEDPNGSHQPDDDIATVTVEYYDNGSLTGSPSTESFTELGPMIDGWRRMEQVIQLPASADMLELHIQPTATSGGAYVDDLRLYPVEAAMNSFVYDRVTGRLRTTLDDNNYGTYYRYAPDGALQKVERETPAGRVTVKESVKQTAKLN